MDPLMIYCNALWKETLAACDRPLRPDPLPADVAAATTSPRRPVPTMEAVWLPTAKRILPTKSK